MSKSHFGLIGLGVMGENLVLNAERKGETVAFRIQDEVLAHHAKTDEAEVRLGHGLKDH